MLNASRVFLLSATKLYLAALCTFSGLASTADTITSMPKIQLNAESNKILQQCETCHGDALTGNLILKAPALAGQSSLYITQQFEHFKTGIRGKHPNDTYGQQMATIAQPISLDENFKQLTLYIEALPVLNHTNTNDPAIDLRQGSNYYQGKCGACHGGEAQGNKSLHAPRLNNLSTEYLAQQMRNFTQGVRGNHAQDKYGRQMAMMAKTTSGQELKNIIAFIQTKRLTANAK